MRELQENIGKRLPYSESDEYLDSLIDKATENAIARKSRPRVNRHLGMLLASAAAVALLVIGIGLSAHRHGHGSTVVATQTGSPLDEFLNSLSDEEAVQLQYYEIEEIPEY